MSFVLLVLSSGIFAQSAGSTETSEFSFLRLLPFYMPYLWMYAFILPF